MSEDIDQKIIQPHDVLAAFGLLTRLPIPVDHARAGKRGAASSWAFPIVGATVGAIAGLIATSLLWIGVPSAMSVALMLGAMAFITGGMHEDGFADFADGVGGGREKKHALEIMKDSRVGAYGAIAIALSLMARWSGYESITGWALFGALVCIGANSRLAMVLLMYAMPAARKDGLAASTGKPDRIPVGLGLLLATLLSLYVYGITGLLILILTCAGALPVAWLAYRKLGGQTGDVLGAAQTSAEITGLAAIIIICG